MADHSGAADVDELFAEVAELGEVFTAAGFQLYLVGGLVRNALVGAQGALDDIDCTTDATPPDIKALAGSWFEALWTQGERFGTIGGKRAGRVYEITTHRAESYVSDSRKPVVTFSTAIEDDLSRRDFTVNAMAWTVPGRDLIDPYGGQADLAAKVLRTPLDPDVSFTDDPLRMLRAARFISRFDLVPSSELLASAERLASRLEIVSIERVHDELHKLLEVVDPSAGLNFLLDNGLSAQFWPELDAAAIERICAVNDGSNLSVRRTVAAMIGLDDDTVSNRVRALKHSNDDTRLIRRMASAGSDWARRRSAPDDEAIRRLALRMGASLVDFVALGTDLGLPQAAEVVASVDRLSAAGELDDLGPELTGEQVMDLLGVGPGPQVGEVLAELQDYRLRDGRHDHDTVVSYARQFWQTASR